MIFFDRSFLVSIRIFIKSFLLLIFFTMFSVLGKYVSFEILRISWKRQCLCSSLVYSLDFLKILVTLSRWFAIFHLFFFALFRLNDEIFHLIWKIQFSDGMLFSLFINLVCSFDSIRKSSISSYINCLLIIFIINPWRNS